MIKRSDIENSSPEIRGLYSRLQQCAIAKENSVMHLENQVREKEKKIKEMEYANLVTSFTIEEHHFKSLEKSDKEAKIMEIRRGLEEQIAMKSSSKILLKADRMLEDMAREDDSKKNYEKIEEERKLRQSKAKELSNALEAQAEQKKLAQDKELIENRLKERATHDQELISSLKEEYRRQQLEVERLKNVESQWEMFSSLETNRKRKEEFEALREELDLLKYKEDEERKVMLKNEGVNQKKDDIIKERDKQIEYKKELLHTEKEMDKRYIEILTEFQNEEAKTAQLSREAKRRRERIHRELSERIIEERKRWRIEEKERRRMEGELEVEERKERLRLLRLQERRIIINHAPHLDEALTQKFLNQISDMCD